MHRRFHLFVKEINHFYLNECSLWTNDHSWEGFQWIDVNNNDQSIISFIRKAKKEEVIVLISFTPITYDCFRVGVPASGKYRIVFNSDQKEYGGTGNITKKEYISENQACHGQSFSIELQLPSYTGLIIKKEAEAYV